MKKSAILSIILAAVLLITGAAYAEMLIYTPAQQNAEVEAGKAVGMPFSVVVDGLSVDGMLRFVADVTYGNLPASWIKASPAFAPVNPMMPSGRTDISIVVPEGTPAGTYTGFVFSTVDGVDRGLDTGRGSLITVVVTEANSCNDTPSVNVISVSPEKLMIPNNKAADVTIEGTVTNAEGCNTLSASYGVTDEYGVKSTSGELALGADGSFTITVPVQAARRGYDQDGRVYTIEFDAQNEMGMLKKSLNVTVLHDAGKKK